MRKLLAALAALAGLAHPAAAGAVGDTLLLVSPSSVVKRPPPLASPTAARTNTTELRIPGHVPSRQLVSVGIDPDGTPVRVTVTQRLTVEGTGDYSFVIFAPATRVAPGPGTQSLPGLRDVGILWQGFSDRRRVLSANITLRRAEAVAALPLGVRIDRRGDSSVVRLENRAVRNVPAKRGRTTRARLLAVLRETRAFYRPPRIVGGPWYARGDLAGDLTVEMTAPLRISGVIAGGSSRVPVDALLGGGRPLEQAFVVPGTEAPQVRLRVELLAPREILPTPRELARARDPFATLRTALDSVAMTAAYQRYLDSPDPAAASSATYVYRSVPRAAATAAPARSDDDDTVTILLLVGLGAAGLVGLAVLWARS